MEVMHFLNVLEGDCNIIQHSSGRTTVIDVSNGSDEVNTLDELLVKYTEARQAMYGTMLMPSDKVDYGQRKEPDNPIEYLRRVSNSKNVHRFIITHPDKDYLGGIRDYFNAFEVANV
ncbi:MAG: hypothetical protein J0I41_24285 [Filimonas sp.]|nr:hypothetical protein [Filimonas sp.]